MKQPEAVNNFLRKYEPSNQNTIKPAYNRIPRDRKYHPIQARFHSM
jgi:hypothetical protein